MDFLSSILVPILKFFWSFCSLCLFCFGLGGFLAGLAFLDAGFWPWPAVLIWWVLCAFSLGMAEPTRRRYLKWQRTNVDDR